MHRWSLQWPHQCVKRKTARANCCSIWHRVCWETIWWNSKHLNFPSHRQFKSKPSEVWETERQLNPFKGGVCKISIILLNFEGCRQIGPGQFGPEQLGPGVPTVRPEKVANWALELDGYFRVVEGIEYLTVLLQCFVKFSLYVSFHQIPSNPKTIFKTQICTTTIIIITV